MHINELGGRVQFTLRQFMDFLLSLSVNCPDGEVSIHAQGCGAQNKEFKLVLSPDQWG